MMNSKNPSYSELAKLYQQVLGAEIPLFEDGLPTFQSIAGYPNYENVISNFYQFFLTDQYHGLGELFIESLKECVLVKRRDQPIDAFDLKSFTVEREYPTKKGGRVDLVLIEDSEDIAEETKVVIIENKIFHTLGNDLDDYWNTFSGSQRAGVLLTLQETKSTQNFVNVTHQEWLKRIEANLGKYILTANSKYLILLQDFLEHMNNFYKSQFNMDALKFVFDNGKQIAELAQIKNKSFEMLQKQIENLVTITSGLEWKKKSYGGVISYTQRKVDVYVVFPNLFSNKRFGLEAWLKVDDMVNDDFSYFNQTINSKVLFQEADDKKFISSDRIKKGWNKLGVLKYKIENYDDLTSIETLVIEKCEKDWLPLVNALERDLKNA